MFCVWQCPCPADLIYVQRYAFALKTIFNVQKHVIDCMEIVLTNKKNSNRHNLKKYSKLITNKISYFAHTQSMNRISIFNRQI